MQIDGKNNLMKEIKKIIKKKRERKVSPHMARNIIELMVC